jgi:hypothetical protein
MHFTKTIAVFITGILTSTMTHGFVFIAPLDYRSVNGILVSVDETNRGNSSGQPHKNY